VNLEKPYVLPEKLYTFVFSITMKVNINSREIEIFRGATVQDAVMAFSERSCRLLKKGEILAFDRFGNPTEPDGELTEGQIITLKKTKKT